MPVRLPLDVDVSLSHSVVSVPLHYLNFSNGALQALLALLYCLPTSWDLECGFVAFGVWERRRLSVRVSCDTTPILLSQLIGEFIVAGASGILVNIRSSDRSTRTWSTYTKNNGQIRNNEKEEPIKQLNTTARSPFKQSYNQQPLKVRPQGRHNPMLDTQN